MNKHNLPVKIPNYFDYLNSLLIKEEIAFIDIEKQIENSILFKTIVDKLPCVVYILNYQTQEYLFFSEYIKNIIGYTREEIMSNGLKFVITSLFHKDDWKVNSEKLFPKLLNYLKNLTPQELRDSRLAITYRLKRKDGAYVKVLQQYQMIECDLEGNPLLNMGVLTDITAHKLDNNVCLSVSRYDEQKGYEVTLFSESGSGEEINISKREKDVMSYIAQGFSTKQIADKLCISFYTVNAHRRNLMGKTKCKNAAELSKFALMNGFI